MINKTRLFSFSAGVLSALLFVFLYNSIFKGRAVDEVKKFSECPPAQDTAVKAPANLPLTAPIIENPKAGYFESDQLGEIRVDWSKVENATRYLIRVYNSDGQLIRTWNSKKTTVFLKNVPFDKNLEFTPYKISVLAVNAADTVGPESQKKDMHAKRMRSVIAPQIESITVED